MAHNEQERKEIRFHRILVNMYFGNEIALSPEDRDYIAKKRLTIRNIVSKKFKSIPDEDGKMVKQLVDFNLVSLSWHGWKVIWQVDEDYIKMSYALQNNDKLLSNQEDKEGYKVTTEDVEEHVESLEKPKRTRKSKKGASIDV